MTHRTPRRQIAVVRFAGKGERLGIPALMLGLLPAAVITCVAVAGKHPQGAAAWFAVVLGYVYSATAIGAAVLRFVRLESEHERTDTRVDEPLSQAIRNEGISESNVRRLSSRRMRRIIDALGDQPPHLWISSRLSYLPIDTPETFAVDAPRIGIVDTPASFRGYVIVILIGTLLFFAGSVSLLMIVGGSSRPSVGPALAFCFTVIAGLALALWWLTRFSSIGLRPGEVILYRRWRRWVHAAFRALNMAAGPAPNGGRLVDASSVRVVMVLQPVPPTTKSEMQRAIFNTTGRTTERVYSWVFIGCRRPLAFSGIDIDTWRMALHAQPRPSR